MQGIQRYVVFAYLALGLVLFVTLDQVFGAIVYGAGMPNPALVGSKLSVATLIALALAVGGAFFGYKHPKASEFSKDVVTELRKVSWPSRKETQHSTVVVIITTLIIAAMLGVFDFIWSELTGLIY